jgi:galactokinase
MKTEQLKLTFEKFFGTGGKIHSFFSPGRVNLIGEHIDYNGGFVFPAALTIGITALWRKRNDASIVLRSLNAEGEIKLDLNADINYDENHGWANYPKGVFRYLQKEGYPLAGGDILFSGSLPDGAGLSSSAALEVLSGFMMLQAVDAAKSIDLTWLALLCQKVENEYMGVNCGIMDQFSVAHGKKDHAILLNCQTLEYQLVPFDMHDYSLVIMDTAKKRELADSKYNERRAECEEILVLLNKSNAYKNLCAASLEQVDLLIKDRVLRKRAIHVITENQRVLESVSVLEKGDLKKFGALLNASHASLKNDYEVTGKELDAIVEAAQKFNGCLGARMTGAGFGGCAIAIVKNSVTEDFKTAIEKEYHVRTGLHPAFYLSAIGDGVHRL